MKNANQPAFAISEEQTDRIDSGVKIYSGLTKREYFAAMAMQGILSGNYPALYGNVDLPAHEYLAQFCTGYADALLNELEKSNTEQK